MSSLASLVRKKYKIFEVFSKNRNKKSPPERVRIKEVVMKNYKFGGLFPEKDVVLNSQK